MIDGAPAVPGDEGRPGGLYEGVLPPKCPLEIVQHTALWAGSFRMMCARKGARKELERSWNLDSLFLSHCVTACMKRNLQKSCFFVAVFCFRREPFHLEP